MNGKSYKKVLIGIVIGILAYTGLELFINDVVMAASTKKGNDEMFPFYWLLLVVGGSIGCTLTYVSWRKYKGEKEEKNKQENDNSFD